MRVAKIEEVIGHYLPLQRKGNAYVGICPFHADRHPSLHVHPARRFFKCFACGEGGDVFGFVQKMEGCSFSGALGKLAEMYHIPVRGMKAEGAGEATVRKYVPPTKVRGALPLPADSRPAARLHAEHAAFLGSLAPYVPACALLAGVYGEAEAGIAPEAVPDAYRSMRSRLVFPIRDEQGVLVGFAGRRPDDKAGDVPKYINSPGSALYVKSRILYGLDKAGESIRRHGFVYITEGYRDVLAMRAAGFRHTVALCGTALTEEHLEILGKYTHRLVLLLDGDRAGKDATDRILCLGRSFDIGRIQLPAGEDPDSFLASEGVEKFRAFLSEKTRFARLEAYEQFLIREQGRLLAELDAAFCAEERAGMLPELMKVKRRLVKVSRATGRNPVLLF